MENASKALLMAASVILGLMIISVGVALFNSFGGSSASIMNKIEKNKIAEFNNQFLKFYGETTEENEKTGKEEIVPIKLTIHDVITLANLAKKNNIEYEVQDQNGWKDNSYYIQVTLMKKYGNLEKCEENILTDLIQNNDLVRNENGELTTKYYYITDLEVSTSKGRVVYVEIAELN